MSAAFFGLAFVAALSAKLFGVDVLLMDNPRARAMFACFLLGALGLSVTLGILDVFVLHAHDIRTQNSVGATIDLVLGVVLLAVGGLIATGRLRKRNKAHAGAAKPERDERWAQRMLREPRLGLAVLIGALCGLPSAPYVTALAQLKTGKPPTATLIIGVALFNLIMFSVVLIPVALLELRPEATRRSLRRANDWLSNHARQLLAAVALVVGAYMAISGLARVLG